MQIDYNNTVSWLTADNIKEAIDEVAASWGWWATIFDATVWPSSDYATISAAVTAWKSNLLVEWDVTEVADISFTTPISTYVKEWVTVTMGAYSFVWGASTIMYVDWTGTLTHQNDFLYKDGAFTGTVYHNGVTITNLSTSWKNVTDGAILNCTNMTYNSPNVANCGLPLYTGSVSSNVKVVWGGTTAGGVLLVQWQLSWLIVEWSFHSTNSSILVYVDGILTNVLNNSSSVIHYYVDKGTLSGVLDDTYYVNLSTRDDCIISDVYVTDFTPVSTSDFSQYTNMWVRDNVAFNSWTNDNRFNNCIFRWGITISWARNSFTWCSAWLEGTSGTWFTLDASSSKNIITGCISAGTITDSGSWNWGSYTVAWGSDVVYFGNHDMTGAVVMATTQSAADNSTKVATTAYVDAAAGGGGASEEFSAQLSSNQSITWWTVDVSWFTENYDTGSNFNATTWIYTAPSAWKYVFSFGGDVYNATAWDEILFMIEVNWTAVQDFRNNFQAQFFLWMTKTLNLSSSDTVNMTVQNNAAARGILGAWAPDRTYFEWYKLL